MTVQIVTNSKGEKTSVLVSYKDWEKLNNRIKELEAKTRIIQGIKDGVKEISEARKLGKELQNLSDFIDEVKDKNF